MMDFRGAARRRTPQAFANAARLLGCEIAAIQAVVDVEATGSGYDKAGRPKALFEPHVFYRNLTGAKQRQAVAAGLAYRAWRRNQYPADSYPRIIAAVAIDETAALKAASWGCGQLLGENYETAGFADPQHMVESFCESEDTQILAMAHFIRANRLDRHLRTRNWAKFAEGYNGPAYAEHGYDRRLLKAYNARTIAAPARFMETPKDIEDPHVDQPPAWNAPVNDEHADIIERDVNDDRDRVAEVQQRLRDLGYFEVGKIDGELLGRTQDAILAFRRAHGLPLTTDIDDEFLAELAKAQPREVSAERATATADDLRAQGSETMGIVDRAKTWAGRLFGLGGSGSVIAVASERASQVGEAKEAVSKLGIPHDAWAMLLVIAAALFVVAGIGLFVWFIANRFEQKRVADYRTGKNP